MCWHYSIKFLRPVWWRNTKRLEHLIHMKGLWQISIIHINPFFFPFQNVLIIKIWQNKKNSIYADGLNCIEIKILTITKSLKTFKCFIKALYNCKVFAVLLYYYYSTSLYYLKMLILFHFISLFLISPLSIGPFLKLHTNYT